MLTRTDEHGSPKSLLCCLEPGFTPQVSLNVLYIYI